MLAAVGLMFYLSSLLRAISMAGRYGLIEAEIPVLQVPIQDTGFKHFTEKGSETLTADTPLVLLTRDAFYFGPVSAFAQDLTNVRNKFYIPHAEGAPQLNRLAKDMERWMQDKEEETGKARSRTVLFLPTEEIPMPIVIQCIAGLRRSRLFDKVVVGGGLI
ncbi:hypothetical protein [Oligoflexus tunisiensis]|uniref:hypothetical protein n=1 Tax=Oligoflexus tunisiensis TaxID=708132 RepID=UPI001C402379|nr:hypothetical protein [Oligoflexus tunisiensis]